MIERIVNSPIGEIVLGASSSGIRLCATGRAARELRERVSSSGETERAPLVLDAAEKALQLYFRGEFSALLGIPLEISGTEFQRSVYHALLSVRAAEILSYKELAEWVGNPAAVRAVGSACRENSLHLFVPCHRVVSIDGELSGFRGGIDIKRYLLNFEREVHTLDEETESANSL